MSRSAIVALGNRLRQDDGVGPWVLDQLAARELPSELSLIWMEHDPSGLCLLETSLAAVIIVDAVAADLTPGTIISLPLTELDCWPPLNLHQISPRELLPEALHERTRILGIVPAAMAYGLELSPLVERAAQRAVEHLSTWAWEHLTARSPATAITVKAHDL